MKVLLLSDWMSNRGGAESYILSLRDELRRQGDDVRLVACGPAASGESHSDARVYGSDLIAAQAVLQIVNPFAVSRVRRVVREFRPDVAVVSQFAYHLSPAVFRALDGVPTAVTMMDYKAICPTGTRLLPDGTLCTVQRGRVCNTNGCIGYAHWIRDRPRYSRIQQELGAGRRVLCPSASMQRELGAAGIDATLVPLGIPVPRGRAGRPATEPLFAYVGRFSREKGVAVLLAAFAAVMKERPEARLRLMGEGPLGSQLHALTQVLGISGSVEFRGWASPESMQEHLDDVWCVVCPSLWAEPFGLAAIESIILGIPVVASDAGGFRETVNDGNGILFRTGDVASLAAAMLSVARGERFPGARLDDAAIEESRGNHGISEHTRRVRSILSEISTGTAS